MIDTSTLNTLITALKAETAKDAITPTYLGTLLDKISELLATGVTTADIAALTQLQSALTTLQQTVTAHTTMQTTTGKVLKSIALGTVNAANVNIDVTKINVGNNATESAPAAIIIGKATTEHAGAMAAQHVTDLNTAKTNIAQLQTLCNTIQTSITTLQNTLNTHIQTQTSTGKVVKSFAQGVSDRNNVYVDVTRINVINNITETTPAEVVIKQATTDRAGAMRAQQVIDLNAAKTGVSQLETSVASLNNSVTSLQQTVSGLHTFYHIQWQAKHSDGLHICGANRLIAMGYVPYIFRYTRKKGKYGRESESRRKAPKRRGWHVFFGAGLVEFTSTELMKIYKHDENGIGEECSADPANLFIGVSKIYEEGSATNLIAVNVTYGSDIFNVLEKTKRFRFAVAFGKPVTRNTRFDFSKLVTNLAEFYVVATVKRSTPDTLECLWSR